MDGHDFVHPTAKWPQLLLPCEASEQVTMLTTYCMMVDSGTVDLTSASGVQTSCLVRTS